MKYQIKVGKNPNSNRLGNDEWGNLYLPLNGIPGDIPDSVNVSIDRKKSLMQIDFEYWGAEDSIKHQRLEDDSVVSFSPDTGRVYSIQFSVKDFSKLSIPRLKSLKALQERMPEGLRKSNRVKANQSRFEHLLPKVIGKARIDMVRT